MCPRIIHGNSLEKNVREYKRRPLRCHSDESSLWQQRKEGVKQNFPADLRSSETADLFMSVIMYRLQTGLGGAPLFCRTASCSARIAQKWRSRKNCCSVQSPYGHRMPHSACLRRTPLSQQTSFSSTGRIPRRRPGFLSSGYAGGDTRTTPKQAHEAGALRPTVEWWDNREKSLSTASTKAKKYTVEELKAQAITLTFAAYPHEEEEILPPKGQFSSTRKSGPADADIDRIAHFSGSPTSLASTLRRATNDARQLKTQFSRWLFKDSSCRRTRMTSPPILLEPRIRTEKGAAHQKKIK